MLALLGINQNRKEIQRFLLFGFFVRFWLLGNLYVPNTNDKRADACSQSKSANGARSGIFVQGDKCAQ
jgi:hypothetical protein